jgi:O-antigen/teichoic acid export membrane protein
MTGTAVTQVIAIAASPILTRLYSPNDYGIIALYTSIAAVFSVIATLRYEFAIVLPKSDKVAINTVSLSIAITVLMSGITMLIIWLFKNDIFKLFKCTDLGNWLYLIPLSVLLFGMFQSFQYWANRKKLFKDITLTNVIQSSTNTSINIGMGIFGMGAPGLFLGLFCGQFAGSAFIGRLFWREKQFYKYITKKAAMKQLRQNTNFPLFSAPMGLLNSVSINLIVFALNNFYSSAIVGVYYLANRVVGVPLGLIANSFAPVFYQKACSVVDKRRIYRKAFYVNFGIALIVMLPFILLGQTIFGIIFGEQWRLSGKILGLMAPYIIGNFAAGSISHIFSATRQNHLSLLWQICFLGFGLLIVYLLKGVSLEHFLLLFAIYAFSMYLILYYLGLYAIMKDEKKNGKI